MSEQNKHRGNKPEKLEIPEFPKNNQGKKTLRNPQPPFSWTLQQMKADAENQVFQRLIVNRRNLIEQIERLRSSKVVVYYSIHLLDAEDFETIFDLLNTLGKQKNLDLYILSPGGFAHPAYKIARLFQSYSENKFSVLIPYYAKSAATILSLGADEIVMGPASELGPIDPQFSISNNSPSISALTLKEALDYITKAIKEDSKTAPLYVPLLDKVDLITLGHFEREIESAKQYGEILLTSKKMNPLTKEKAEEVANDFVQQYKTHGFVIDGQAASSLLSEKTIKLISADDPTWQCMWQLHNTYNQYIKDKRTTVKIIETLNASYEKGNQKIK